MEGEFRFNSREEDIKLIVVRGDAVEMAGNKLLAAVTVRVRGFRK